MSTLKSSLLKILSPYQYPQSVFGKEIGSFLKSSGFNGGHILDCPCGNGEVSYHLSGLNNAVVKGADIDQASVNIAVRNFKRKNLVFEKADIFDVLAEKTVYDVICVVNSLFLLPDHDRLFALLYERLRDQGSKLVIITPNPESVNFKNFQALHPGINKTVLYPEGMRTKAQNMCFTLTGAKEIVYASYYGRHELKFFSVFAPFYLLALNFFKKFQKQKQGNYIMYCLTKNYEGT